MKNLFTVFVSISLIAQNAWARKIVIPSQSICTLSGDMTYVCTPGPAIEYELPDLPANMPLPPIDSFSNSFGIQQLQIAQLEQAKLLTDQFQNFYKPTEIAELVRSAVSRGKIESNAPGLPSAVQNLAQSLEIPPLKFATRADLDQAIRQARVEVRHNNGLYWESLNRFAQMTLKKEQEVMLGYLKTVRMSTMNLAKGSLSIQNKNLTNALLTNGKVQSARVLGELGNLGLVQSAPLAYDFRSSPSPERAELESQLHRLNTIPDGTPRSNLLKGYGFSAIQEADQSLAQGDQTGYAFYKNVATAFIDIGLSLTPVVGWGKDIYEATTGKSLITGERLPDYARTIAVIGILTLGVTSEVSVVSKYLGKLFKTTSEARQFESIAKIAGKVTAEIPKSSLKVLSEATSAITQRLGKVSYETRRYLINQVRHQEAILGRGSEFTGKMLESIGLSRENLSVILSKIKGVPMEVKVVRASDHVGAEVGGRGFRLEKADELGLLHEKNAAASHRFSQPGERAIYTSDSFETVAAELGVKADSPLVVKTFSVRAKKVLDLTDENNLRELGLSLEDITAGIFDDFNPYKATQIIGNLARENGFDAIRTPSAAVENGINYIFFKELK